MRGGSLVVFALLLSACPGGPDAIDGVDAVDGGPGASPPGGDPVDEDEGDVDVGGFDPGVDGSTPLNALTPDERDVACTAQGAYEAASGVNAAACLIDGYAAAAASGATDDATLRDGCATRVAACLQEKLDGRAFGHLCSAGFNCTGTVEQAVACAVEAGQGKVTATQVLPACESLTAGDLPLLNQLQLPPAPACAALNATCQ